MIAVGMSPRGATARDTGVAQPDDEMERALRARDDIEQVTIETVHVGDYVFLDAAARPATARCVIRKRAKTNERTARIVGWLVELTGDQLAWWPRGELVWRRRIPV